MRPVAGRGPSPRGASSDRQHPGPRHRRTRRAVPGVSVTLTSPALVAGTATGVTDAAARTVSRRSLRVSTRSRSSCRDSGPSFVRTSTVHGRPDGAARSDAARRDGGRNGHRHRHLAGRRHDERQHERQPGRAVAAGHARRPRHLVAGRIQGAEPAHHAPRRRRHVGRPAGRVQRARHDQRAELAAT